MVYAKVNEVFDGTVLVSDGGFTCLYNGQESKVYKDSTGLLYIECDIWNHFIDGQIEGDEYIGLKVK